MLSGDLAFISGCLTPQTTFFNTSLLLLARKCIDFLI